MFSWKRGILHALIPFAAVIALGLLVVAVKDVADPEKFGEGLGRFAVVSLLAGMAVSYLFQTGKRKAGWGVLAGFVLVIGAVAFVLFTIDPRPEIDRRALIDDGVTLRHPSLGFTLKRPPADFHDAPQLVKGMGDQGKDTVIYAYAPATPGVGLIIGVIWGTDHFDAVVRGVKRGLLKSGATWDDEQIGTDVAHLRAHIRTISMRVDLHQVHGAIVTLNVMSPDPNALADVISSFQP